MAGAWKTRLEQAGYTVGCSFIGLGELPWVQEMYRERLEELF
ncbi:MAG: sirohydrochlorin cobaltochelatase [Oscillospiraceae bacterium]|nr:sirohydrochlorin cobaltochelatase [Oscillospiraceae bacterium]